MKRLSRMVGVTLLEIMLVLAVASLVIVMSIRYYQSTQVAVATQTIQRGVASMIAYADSFGSGAGTYSGLTAEGLWSSLPTDLQGSSPTMKSPWGAITIAKTSADDTGYVVTLTQANVPDSACQQVAAFANSVLSQRSGGKGECKSGVITLTGKLNIK